MNAHRLEAFSDGVIAILITIMVLDLHVPTDATAGALRAVAPTFVSYLLSFIIIGIYWNSHHHLFQAIHRVSGRVLWANLHLLFWLSLIPFTTRWVGEHYGASIPTALYGIVLLLAAIAYIILQTLAIAHEGADSTLSRAIGGDVKGKISLALNAIAVISAFVQPWLADLLYVVGAMIWFVPDRRIERALQDDDPSQAVLGP